MTTVQIINIQDVPESALPALLNNLGIYGGPLRVVTVEDMRHSSDEFHSQMRELFKKDPENNLDSVDATL